MSRGNRVPPPNMPGLQQPAVSGWCSRSRIVLGLCHVCVVDEGQRGVVRCTKVRVKNGRKYAHNYDAARKINRGKSGSQFIIRELAMLDRTAR